MKNVHTKNQELISYCDKHKHKQENEVNEFKKQQTPDSNPGTDQEDGSQTPTHKKPKKDHSLKKAKDSLPIIPITIFHRLLNTVNP